MHTQSDIIAYIEQSLRLNWERLALTDFQGQSFQYRDVARKIANCICSSSMPACVAATV